MNQMLSPQKTKIGREPVVVLPIQEWEAIRDKLEDLEMYNLAKLQKEITKARKEVKQGEVFTLKEVESALGVKKY
jgi:PHD/YefM family antitoxin component YafN of YafNO toxin-antitoxin module